MRNTTRPKDISLPLIHFITTNITMLLGGMKDGYIWLRPDVIGGFPIFTLIANFISLIVFIIVALIVCYVKKIDEIQHLGRYTLLFTLITFLGGNMIAGLPGLALGWYIGSLLINIF